MAAKVRRDLLARTLLEVLRDANDPLQPAEAIKHVEQRVPFTASEASLNNSGLRRGETTLRWVSSWATAVGWMTKKGGWSLTEAGADALEELPQEGFSNHVNKLYQSVLKQKKSGATPTTRKWAKVHEVVSLVPPGFWTTYDDIAACADTSPGDVGGYLSNVAVTGAHRVLRSDGTVSPESPVQQRPGDFRQRLEDEGITFDHLGVADRGQRISADELVDLMRADDATSRRAWLVRGSSVVGVNMVPTWLAQGWCSLAANQLRLIEPPIDRDALQQIVEHDYSHLSYNARGEKLAEFDTFLNRMNQGDLVLANDGGQIYLGEVIGEATMLKSPDERSNLRRAVHWLNAGSPVDFAELPQALTARLSSQHTIVDLTLEVTTLEGLLPHDGEQPASPGAPTHTLADATAELADRLLVDQEWLQESIDLLRDRKQLIFYGPPGTGKTYLAQEIARHVTAAEHVKLVQFHPAYSYEDFFEGYRPAAAQDGDTTVGFKLTPGPFRRLVDAARDDTSQAYVLIIDEINRANLAKVFGELYFLLEYREHSIDLLYSSGDDTGFTLPENVYLMGTMNTADRSIALVDAAMRRRFAFLPLHPGEPPTSGVLRRWLHREQLPDTTADVLDELNRRIQDEDFKIGPSYFMRASVHSDGGLDRVWRTAILPLLEEHHFGDAVDVRKQYSLASILKTVQSAHEPTDDAQA